MCETISEGQNDPHSPWIGLNLLISYTRLQLVKALSLVSSERAQVTNKHLFQEIFLVQKNPWFEDILCLQTILGLKSFSFKKIVDPKKCCAKINFWSEKSYKIVGPKILSIKNMLDPKKFWVHK